MGGAGGRPDTSQSVPKVCACRVQGVKTITATTATATATATATTKTKQQQQRQQDIMNHNPKKQVGHIRHIIQHVIQQT
eukprot:365664-Chlamydomonas_euryale.AAC.6